MTSPSWSGVLRFVESVMGFKDVCPSSHSLVEVMALRIVSMVVKNLPLKMRLLRDVHCPHDPWRERSCRNASWW